VGAPSADGTKRQVPHELNGSEEKEVLFCPPISFIVLFLSERRGSVSAEGRTNNLFVPFLSRSFGRLNGRRGAGGNWSGALDLFFVPLQSHYSVPPLLDTRVLATASRAIFGKRGRGGTFPLSIFLAQINPSLDGQRAQTKQTSVSSFYFVVPQHFLSRTEDINRTLGRSTK